MKRLIVPALLTIAVLTGCDAEASKSSTKVKLATLPSGQYIDMTTYVNGEMNITYLPVDSTNPEVVYLSPEERLSQLKLRPNTIGVNTFEYDSESDIITLTYDTQQTEQKVRVLSSLREMIKDKLGVEIEGSLTYGFSGRDPQEDKVSSRL